MRTFLLAPAAAITAALTLGAIQAPTQQPSAPPAGQQPAPGQQPPSGQQPPVFRGGTANVRVDVTVIDKKGNPVADLTKDDFEVREDGLPQVVDTLKMIHATGEAPDDDTSLPIRSPEHAAVEAARDDIRVFVIFWDEYHIGQLLPGLRAREALSEFVQTAFGPTDLVALMDQLTPTDAIRFTRDRRDLAEQVRTLKGRQGIYVPTRSAVEDAQLYRGRDIEMLRSQVTATALEATIAFLGTIKEGHKSILFVSQTIGRVGSSMSDTTEWLDRAVRLANANNTTIYSLDPRGLDMNLRRSDILLSLAENTGGRQFANNAPATSLREIVKESSAFYLLGYRSEKNPADGKFHKIAVHVKRPGVDVKARTGYFAPSAAEMDTARKKAAESEAPPDIAKALSTLVDAPHVPVSGDLWAGATPGPDGRPRIALTWSARDAANAAAVSVRASADNGTVFFDGPLESGQASFPAEPGTLHLRRSLLDASGALSDRQDSTLDVPDFAKAPLSIATPVLYRGRTPIELRAIQSGGATPFAGRQFDRTDRLIVHFDVFGPSAADATVSVTLLNRTGAKLAGMPLRKTPAGAYEIDLPIASIARGEYVFEIAASHGGDHAKTLLSFKVN